jgi:hypothetical protein
LIIKYFEGKFSQYKITKTGEKLSIRTGIAFFQKLRVKLRRMAIDLEAEIIGIVNSKIG